MFGKRLSRGIAVACLALSFALPSASLAVSPATSERGAVEGSRAPLPPLYRYVNYRFVSIEDVPHECFDVEVSSDGGQTWTYVETICNPL